MISRAAIEAGARAIYESRNGAGCKPWSLQTKSHKEPYLSDAEAALSALAAEGMALVPTSPTLDMQRAYFDEIDRNMRRVQTDATFGRFCNHRLAYAAMLKAAGASDAGK